MGATALDYNDVLAKLEATGAFTAVDGFDATHSRPRAALSFKTGRATARLC